MTTKILNSEREILSNYLDKYQTEGFSFFPIPIKSKQANIKWDTYQSRTPTLEEIDQWKSNGITNIAIVCGAVSGNLVVIDFDTQDKFFNFCDVLHQKDIDIFTYTRLVRTSKGMHVYFRLPATVKSQKFPQIDLKAEGGYVIAPPSVHPSGSIYELVNPDIPIRHIESLQDVCINLNQKQSTNEKTNQPGWVSELLKGVSEGSRNDSAVKLAGYFRNTLPQDVTERLMLDWAGKCTPPLPKGELLAIVGRAYQKFEEHTPLNNPLMANTDTYVYSAKKEGVNLQNDKNTTGNTTTPLVDRVIEWVKQTNGWFSYEDIDKEFGLTTAPQKDNRWHIIKRLKDAGTIESHPKNNKLLRFINTSVRLIDFKKAGNRTSLQVKYPFGIEKYFNTYPGNIIVIAGVTDTGKTSFLFNFVRLNMYDFPIYYQSSEMGDTEIASRLQLFEDIELQDWNFTPEERATDFADVIRPDAINIIDYVELTENFYLAAQVEKEIHEKLRGGIAIIAMQKNENAPYAIGGILTASLPRLYLTIDKHPDGQVMRMKKAKNWVNPEVNPNRLALKYKIYKGSKLIVTQDWYEDVK